MPLICLVLFSPLIHSPQSDHSGFIYLDAKSFLCTDEFAFKSAVFSLKECQL